MKWPVLDSLLPPTGRGPAGRDQARTVALCAPATAVLLMAWHAAVGRPSSTLDALVIALPVALLAVPFLLRSLTSVRAGVLVLAAWGGVSTLAAMLRVSEPVGPLVGVLAVLIAIVAYGAGARTAAAYTGLVSAATLVIGVALGQAPAGAMGALSLVGISGVITLIDRERAHWMRQARDAQARFEMASTDGLEGVFDWSLLTDEIVYSPRFREILGYDGFSQFPPLPQSLMSPDLLVAEDYESVRDAIQPVANGVATGFDLECRLLTSSGCARWVRLRGHLTRAVDGTPGRITGAIRDISAQRDAEELAERFLHAASTQFRAPLTSIRGVHRLMTGGAFGELPQLATRMLGIAERNSAHLEELVDQLLELRRLRRRALRLDLEPMRAADIATMATEAARAELAESGVLITLDATGSDALIQADAPRLVRALRTFATAGADHLTGAATVHIGVVASPEEVRFEIQREGTAHDIGFQQDVARVLTEALSDEEPFDALSLGLSVSKAVVEAHGGVLTVQRPSGPMLTVSVVLRRVVAVPEPSHAVG